MSSALYNEIEPFACDWLENLIAAGHVASGIVERRSIVSLSPDDVCDATQAHFFAGIAVWSAALRAAGWPDDVPIWTGSCPCQPFSQAGRGKGVDDERHLWPEWFRLIRELRPAVIVGEQVASPAGLEWLDAVFADLEGAGYACAAVDLCAAGVGAPHIRQRLYFVALADRERLEGIRVRLLAGRSQQTGVEASRGSPTSFVADAVLTGRPEWGTGTRAGSVAGGGFVGGLADSQLHDRTGRIAESHGWLPVEPDRHGTARGVGDADENASRGHSGAVPRTQTEMQRAVRSGPDGSRNPGENVLSGFWADAEWIPCTDGIARPAEPGTFPLAHGATARVGRLRAYGNAIVRPQAQIFLETVIDLITL